MTDTEANIVAWHFISPLVEKVAIVAPPVPVSVAMACGQRSGRAHAQQYGLRVKSPFACAITSDVPTA